jgi:hypothetical protein
MTLEIGVDVDGYWAWDMTLMVCDADVDIGFWRGISYAWCEELLCSSLEGLTPGLSEMYGRN